MIRMLISAAGSLLPLAVLADAQLQMVDNASKVDATYQIKGGKVRMESADAGAVTMIYDAATHGMTILDSGQRSYMRMDAQTVANAGAAMSDAMSELDKRLADLPPEQREAMKQFLPKTATAGGPPVPAVTAERTGKTDTVSGKPCDLVNVTMDGKPVGEACIASAGLGISGADQQTLDAMFADMSKMAASVLSRNARAGQEFAALGGVPLRWRDADTGRVTETRVDTKVAIDAAAFEIPAGYAEQKIDIPTLNR